MPDYYNLSYSKRDIVDNPHIIKRSFEYNYETFYNTPRMILVIENKLVKNDILNSLSTNGDNLSFKIDYNELNPSLPNNIFNYMNMIHSQMIKFNDSIRTNPTDVSTEETNGFIAKKNNSQYKFTNNYNFAYHYFIDKKGNIYEGRPHSIRAYNLDIYKYNPVDIDNPENKQYDSYTGQRILPLLDPSNSLFNDSLIILTEEQTNDIDTSNATYTALKSLINYLKKEYGYKEFYGYSELKQIPFNNVADPKEDLTVYNNPGLFFKINELHSAIDNKPLYIARRSKDELITIFTYGERDLKYLSPTPMEGNDVLMLQKMLYKLKLLPRYADITSTYNLATKQAVSKFQKKYYITPTYNYGVADINTLNEIRNRIYKEKRNNEKLIDDNYNPFRVLEYNPTDMMTGYDVMVLQNRLKRIIYPILNVTGIFDAYTKDAVSMFQAKYSSYIDNDMNDGKVGPNTWKEILDCKDILYVDTDDPDVIIEGSITPTHTTVSKTNMIYLQRALNEMLKAYGIEIPLTGGYDELTQKYIKIINKNEYNRKTIGLDKYTDKDGNPIDWTNDYNLKTCYPAEYIWLIKHYLLHEKITLELVNENS